MMSLVTNGEEESVSDSEDDSAETHVNDAAAESRPNPSEHDQRGHAQMGRLRPKSGYDGPDQQRPQDGSDVKEAGDPGALFQGDVPFVLQHGDGDPAKGEKGSRAHSR